MEFRIPIPRENEVTSGFSIKWYEFVKGFHSHVFSGKSKSKRSFLLYYGAKTLNGIHLENKISEEEISRQMECIEMLENKCLFQVVICFLRHLFFTHCRRGTSLKEFYAELCFLSELCSFEDSNQDDLVKQQLISNICDESARGVFLSFENLTAANILDVCDLADEKCTKITPDLINVYFTEKQQQNLHTNDPETNFKKDFGMTTVLFPRTHETGVTEGLNISSLLGGVSDDQCVHSGNVKTTLLPMFTDLGAHQREDSCTVFPNCNETTNQTVVSDSPVLGKNFNMFSSEKSVLQTNESESCTYFSDSPGNWKDEGDNNDNDDFLMSVGNENTFANEPRKEVGHQSDSCSDGGAIGQNPVLNLPNYSFSRDFYFSEVPSVFISQQSAILTSYQHKEGSGQPFQVYSCKLCQFTSMEKILMKEHSLHIHQSLNCFVCTICNLKFPSKYQIESHVRLKHLNAGEQKCQICDIVFDSQILLYQHLQRHSEQTKKTCNVCFASFQSKVLLAKHMFDSHSDLNKWVCRVCTALFKTRTALSDHISEAHGDTEFDDDKFYNYISFCKICDIRFTDEKAKDSHYRKFHKKKKPLIFPCDKCNYTTDSKCNLIRHQRRHTGERPYMCEICSKSFAQVSSFTFHMRSHTGEKPYKCQYCNASLSSSSSKVLHEKRHRRERPHICALCGKRFLVKYDLKLHMKTHDDCREKEFVCYCGSKFSARKHLLRHQRSHSGQKSYFCEICGAGFTRPENLRGHQKSNVCSKTMLRLQFNAKNE